ncbi:double zinc ribbon domain-containing protein [Halobellus ruber]|uniref:Ribbon-helix-helix protein, CopG family n=1 Tax=Halobellus ruber TaxID=2761102 RepID=A0A7J9SKS9_9EURY|nr:zinc ribbon domain-containing protein [Halobellus ruber]MBB6647560.1 ribbon-helix-helix protein, CopG family [Halobellus ruber]
MSKITFRADDDLVERLEGLDTSKSEAMREALRAYLDGADRDDDGAAAVSDAADAGGSVDDVIRERVDELVADRVDAALEERVAPVGRSRDLNVNLTLDGVNAAGAGEDAVSSTHVTEADGRKTQLGTAESDAGDAPAAETCDKCGEAVDGDHVYCPNCGEKASHRVFCECGDELRSDWAFCPGCGRRTSAADVLDRA